MADTKVFRLERYDLTCSATACDNGMFTPVLVIAKNEWPSRPRSIAVQRELHPSAEGAIEAAYAQGLEWVRNFG